MIRPIAPFDRQRSMIHGARNADSSIVYISAPREMLGPANQVLPSLTCACNFRRSKVFCEFLRVQFTYTFTYGPVLHIPFDRMTDMRPSFYVSLMLLGWSITLVTASDPWSRINDIISDENSLQFYAHCFLDKGPCSGDGRALKRLLPEFISTSCLRCSDKQKQMACKIIYTLQQEKYSDLWHDFLAKYDPHSQYRVNLDNFMQTCSIHH